ncbi:MAG: hypothetical protein HY260_21485 [Chloroflexi bacterium]|nr:hypothetical protein [Chloroflexota bacterium]
MSQVAPTANDKALLLQSALAAFKMIFISGDPYERFNYPYRPIFGPILGAFFVVGVATTIARAVRARTPLARAAEFMLLVWIPAMLLPTILAVHEIFPSNVRAIGLIPLIFVPTARGLIETTQWIVRRFLAAELPTEVQAKRRIRPKPHPLFRFLAAESRISISLVSTVSLISLCLSTSSAYFLEWGRWPIVYRDNDADLAAAARWLNEQDTANTSIFMSAIHYRHPTIAFLAQDYSRMRWFTGANTLAIPPTGGAIYIFPHSAPPPDEWIAQWSSALVAAPPGPDGESDFRAYRFNAPPPTPPYTTSPANFDNIVALTGYRAIRAVSGKSVVVDLYWRVLNPPGTGDFRVVADLVDAWGYHWAQGFNDSYPSEQWQADETLITRVEISAPIGLPPGDDYRLAVTLFAPSTGARLTTIDSAGRFAGATANVGPIAVAQSAVEYEPDEVTPSQSSDLRLGPVSLIGYDPPATAALPGARLDFALYWQASVAPRETYLTTVTLDAPGGVLESGSPVHDSYPTGQWHSGEIVIDRHAPRLPRDLSPGWYLLKLTLSESSGESKHAALGGIHVLPIERVFAPPAPTRPANLTLGDTVRLIGFDLAPLASDLRPPTSSLTLYWQSLAETETDYTVFVHVLDANGQIVAQRDAAPRDNAYPTSLWMKGEYVSDPYTIALASGTYALEVGMYLPENGKTLGGGRIGEVTVP